MHSKSGHFLSLKNSSFKCPKTCSVAPLSMQLPFRDMLCTTPAFSSLLHHPACWYCQPISECSIGLAPSGFLDMNSSSSSCCWAMSGCSDVDQATISLLPKSQIGAK